MPAWRAESAEASSAPGGRRRRSAVARRAKGPVGGGDAARSAAPACAVDGVTAGITGATVDAPGDACVAGWGAASRVADWETDGVAGASVYAPGAGGWVAPFGAAVPGGVACWCDATGVRWA